jgi:hypothetical protein
MNIVTATDPKWANAEHTAIDLNVKFVEFNSVVPFTASNSDSQQHSIELFNNALRGVYGLISDYVEPESTEHIQLIQVSMRQMRLALLHRGLLDSVNSTINSITDAVARETVKIEWDYSITIKKNAAWFQTLTTQLQIIGEDYDNLFTEALTY